MVRMAKVYQTEGNVENAFILYLKFSTLFVEKIPTHPEYRSFDSVTKKQNNEQLKEVIPLAEKLKAKLKERFEQEYLIHLEREAKRAKELERRRKEEVCDQWILLLVLPMAY